MKTERLFEKTLVLAVTIFCLIHTVIASNIKSSTGNITIDSNSDGNPDIILYSTSVGIGSTSPSSVLHIAGNTSVSNKVGVGATAPKSNLEIAGTFSLNTQTISSNTTLSGNSIVFIDNAAAGGNLDITLPDVATVSGRMYTIKKVSAGNTVVISGDTTIDGAPSLTLNETSTLEPFVFVDLINDGSEWFILNAKSDSITTGPTGLQAWYTFNETSGNTIYDRTPGTQSNGTLNGGFSFSSNSIAGQFGSALVFDGTDDYIDLGDADELFFSTQVTIAFWGRAFSSDRVVWEKSNNFSFGHINFQFEGFTPTILPQISFMGTDFSVRTSQAASSVGSSDWVHVVGRYRNSDQEVSIFINGTKQADTETMTATTLGVASSYRRTFIGAHDFNGGLDKLWQGYMDDLRFYYGALTDAEIQVLYDEKP